MITNSQSPKPNEVTTATPQNRNSSCISAITATRKIGIPLHHKTKQPIGAGRPPGAEITAGREAASRTVAAVRRESRAAAAPDPVTHTPGIESARTACLEGSRPQRRRAGPTTLIVTGAESNTSRKSCNTGKRNTAYSHLQMYSRRTLTSPESAFSCESFNGFSN